MTVGTTLNRNMQVADSQLILSDVSMHRTFPTAANCLYLLAGPSLFASSNLLAADTSIPTQDHSRLQLTLGNRGAHSFAGSNDNFGADSYSYLVEGEKVWFMAPYSSRVAFGELFVRDRCSMFTLDEDRSRMYEESGIIAVHQREGDVVYVPGGWVYSVIHLCATVSFGAPYIRAWKLDRTVDYARMLGSSRKAQVDIDSFFDAVAAADEPEEWGTGEEEFDSNRKRWEALKEEWKAKST